MKLFIIAISTMKHEYISITNNAGKKRKTWFEKEIVT